MHKNEYLDIAKLTPAEKKERFLDLYKKEKNETTARRALAISARDLERWQHTDPEFKKQYESYKNGAKHKIRAEIITRALEGVVTETIVDGKIVKKVRSQDPTVLKLAYQIVNSDDLEYIQDHLPEEIKLKFI